jgi:predicted DNA-binding ribbon-helix-helix protein
MGDEAGGGRPVKRSLTLSGHRTSVTLEAPFWDAFDRMAAEAGASRDALAARIDAARAPGVGLASALRVAVLAWALGRL